MTHQWTATTWEQEYDRLYPGALNPHRNAALVRAGDIFEMLGLAEARADAALRAERVVYTSRLGFAQRNLMECWFWWAGLTRLDPKPEPELRQSRKLLQHAIAQYRQLRDQQFRGIVGRLDGAAA